MIIRTRVESRLVSLESLSVGTIVKLRDRYWILTAKKPKLNSVRMFNIEEDKEEVLQDNLRAEVVQAELTLVERA